jgi:hypothetical protein
MVFTALMAKVTTMPASMPEATEAGIREISPGERLEQAGGDEQERGDDEGADRLGMVKPEEAAISAAPGVDQAVITGIFVRHDSQEPLHRHGEAERGDPARRLDLRGADRLAAAMMSASVPPKPTIAATKAEMGIDSAHGLRLPCRPSAATMKGTAYRNEQIEVLLGRDRRWSPSGISDSVTSSGGSRPPASSHGWRHVGVGVRPCRMTTGHACRSARS